MHRPRAMTVFFSARRAAFNEYELDLLYQCWCATSREKAPPGELIVMAPVGSL